MIFTLGINHHSAPLAIRERVAFHAEGLPKALAHLVSAKPVKEAAILSTCNRMELYCTTDAPAAAADWLAEYHRVERSRIEPYLYTFPQPEAVRHAFRVASGLDSMVIGEPQILGQMKDAVRAAESAGALGSTLNQLFQRSFAVAKEVRTSTEIGAHSISMAAAAVRLASQIFEDLGKTKVLFVGAGEMVELTATHFAARNPQSIAIANRTLERGERLAARFGAEVLRLADLPERLHEFDIVVSCTASTLPIVGLGAVERALKKRRHRPMFMVDLAVPRDIEPEVKALRDVYLYTVDDLASVVQTAQASRQAAVEQAEVIIDAGVQSFMHWMDQRDPQHGVVPLIRQIQEQTDQWRAIELARARRRLARGEDVDAVLEALSRGLSRKMLHGTMAELRASDAEARDQTARTASRLFLRSQSKTPL